MRSRLSIFALIALAACGTPQEQCVRRNTGDLRATDQMIREAEGNLARGYALEEFTVTRTRWVRCYGPPAEPGGKPTVTRCLEREPETVTRAKRIDLDAEAAKLAVLKSKRVTLARQAESVVRQCRELYPET